jgi:peptidoglycan/xylan/chitin deacetylase (PgdA/CDA1 family)
VIASVAALGLVGLALVAVTGDGDEGAQRPPGTSVTTATTATTTPSTSRGTASTAGPSPSSTTTVAPPLETPAVVVRRGPTGRPAVALTFDAGSDTGWAAAILDTLAANGVPATFGMTGGWARANPSLVRRMVAGGHQLVNHSDDHPSFTGRSTATPPLSRAERLDQLARADAAIREAAGITTAPWFRPPYGDEDASVRADIASAGYRYELLWTVDSLGWRGASADSIVRRSLDEAVPGAIYLFHVGAASADHAALQGVIDGLRSRGYGFLTASQLVSA